MASTRSKNTPGNYCLDQRQNTGPEAWLLYKYGANGVPFEQKLPGVGLNPGQMPYHGMSHNPADIESFLWGINSTNLVNPAGPLTPELKCLQSADLFKKEPVLMPVPLVVSKSQRPFPLP